MKNKLSVLLITLILIAFSASTAMAFDAIVKWREGQTAEGSTQRIGFRYPLPVQEQSFESYQATSTVTITSATAVKCPTLATDTRVLQVGAIGGDLNFGTSTVPTGVYPFKIASGTYKPFNIATKTPELYFRAADTDVTVYYQEY